MTTDSIMYLSVAASVSSGNGFHFLGRATQHLPGYAGMIAVLDRMGIARPWSLVGLNCGFLLLGLAARTINGKLGSPTVGGTRKE